MVRTQIQLTAAQASEIRRIMASRGISMAELIRQAIDAHLARQPGQGGDRRRELALEAAGRFAVDSRLSTDHDAAFGEGDVR